jgi:hypothetical protein
MYLSNTELLTSLGCPLNAVFRILRKPVPLDAGTPLLSLLQTLNYLLSQLQCMRTCPGRRVTEKSHLFHTNCRSGRDQGMNPGHLRSRQRRKPLIHPLRLAPTIFYALFDPAVPAVLKLPRWKYWFSFDQVKHQFSTSCSRTIVLSLSPCPLIFLKDVCIFFLAYWKVTLLPRQQPHLSTCSSCRKQGPSEQSVHSK